MTADEALAAMQAAFDEMVSLSATPEEIGVESLVEAWSLVLLAWTRIRMVSILADPPPPSAGPPLKAV